jgi:hypothetical protein
MGIKKHKKKRKEIPPQMKNWVNLSKKIFAVDGWLRRNERKSSTQVI